MTPPTTEGAVVDDWGAITAVVQLRQQLGEPSLPLPLRCVPIRIWGRRHPSPPTTGGPIATIIRLCRQLGEELLPLPLLTISANNRVIRLRPCLSLPTTGGAVIDIAASCLTPSTPVGAVADDWCCFLLLFVSANDFTDDWWSRLQFLG
jgi:hypothetical protein